MVSIMFFSSVEDRDQLSCLFIYHLTEKEKKKSSKGDPNDPRVRLKRDCVGLMAAFKLNCPSNPIVVVANTHIYW
jgi:hypothetical protein